MLLFLKIFPLASVTFIAAYIAWAKHFLNSALFKWYEIALSFFFF